MALLRSYPEKGHLGSTHHPAFPFPSFLLTLISLQTLRSLIENTAKWVIHYIWVWFALTQLWVKRVLQKMFISLGVTSTLQRGPAGGFYDAS